MQEKRKPPSGWQRRKLRMEQGLPAVTGAEVASRRARSARNAAERAAANLAFLNELKLEAGCADCGYRGHPAALDFDHLPGSSKIRGLARMLLVSRATLLAEIAKCEIVCANCHRIRTWNRRRESQQAA